MATTVDPIWLTKSTTIWNALWTLAGFLTTPSSSHPVGVCRHGLVDTSARALSARLNGTLAPGAATDVGGAGLVEDADPADGELEQPVMINAPPTRSVITTWRPTARRVTVPPDVVGHSGVPAENRRMTDGVALRASEVKPNPLDRTELIRIRKRGDFSTLSSSKVSMRFPEVRDVPDRQFAIDICNVEHFDLALG